MRLLLALALLALGAAARHGAGAASRRLAAKCSSFRPSKRCAGGRHVASGLEGLHKLQDEPTCAAWCAAQTERHGELCCSLTLDGRCWAKAGASVADLPEVALLRVGGSGREPRWGSAARCTPADKSLQMRGGVFPISEICLLVGRLDLVGDAARAAHLRCDSSYVRPALMRRVSPAGPCQGRLADCWLISAMSCMARYPQAVRRLFYQQEYSESGLYDLQLYDLSARRWVRIRVNDEVQVVDRSSAFAQLTSSRELWPVLLEKAFAQLVTRKGVDLPDFSKLRGGGYAALEGGNTVWAFATLTGGELQVAYGRPPGRRAWRKVVLEPGATAQAIRAGDARGLCMRPAWPQRLQDGDLWAAMLRAERSGWLMGAWIVAARGGAGGERALSDGLHTGHSYSVLGVEEVRNGDHEVCVEEVVVAYGADDAAALALDLSRLEPLGGDVFDIEASHRAPFRGWGVGEVVWAYAGAGPILARVGAVSSRGVLLTTPAAPARPLGAVPESSVIGPQELGMAAHRGVLPGWSLTRACNASCDAFPGDATVLVFEGVADPAACLAPGSRLVRRDRRPVKSLRDGEVLRLVKIRNPWGRETRYNGTWSDADTASWARHPDVAAALGRSPAFAGTSWVPFEAFTARFHGVAVSETSMADFNPLPPECNTDWSGRRYFPSLRHGGLGRSLALAWPLGAALDAEECARCVPSRARAAPSRATPSCAGAFYGFGARAARAEGGAWLCCRALRAG